VRYDGALQPGDVLVTREKAWPWADLILLGAKMTGRPAYCNHVIIVHHQDLNGTWWGVEGRPGGVGDRDLSGAGNGPAWWPLTNANNRQPITDDQRATVCDLAWQFRGRPYDWEGIAADVREALGFAWALPKLPEFRQDQVPAHVVCSSFADWVYGKAGLPNPSGSKVIRMTTPGDWDRFIMTQGWK
jgi:hypothetical protein